MTVSTDVNGRIKIAYGTTAEILAQLVTDKIYGREQIINFWYNSTDSKHYVAYLI